jgi:hypothetical protein
MPADILLDRVCGLVRDLHQAVEVVAAAVTEKGEASLAELRRTGSRWPSLRGWSSPAGSDKTPAP